MQDRWRGPRLARPGQPHARVACRRAVWGACVTAACWALGDGICKSCVAYCLSGCSAPTHPGLPRTRFAAIECGWSWPNRSTGTRPTIPRAISVRSAGRTIRAATAPSGMVAEALLPAGRRGTAVGWPSGRPASDGQQPTRLPPLTTPPGHLSPWARSGSGATWRSV